MGRIRWPTRSEPSPTPWPFAGPALDRRFARYRAALCGSTLIMVGLSWPLWVDSTDFPRVPFLRGWPAFPAWVSWLTLVGILATLGLASIGRQWRVMFGISLPLLAFAILGDQNRFQPWAYQFLIVGPALAFMQKGRALRMARWSIFALYNYSGISKLDASFCREMGPTFLSAMLGPIGIDPSAWPDSGRVSACLAMPAFEIAVAWLLVFDRSRRIGLIGAVAQHLALVFVLGPWNLGHSTIVLVWNLALILEDVILFGVTTIPTDLEPETFAGRLVKRAFWVAMIVPGGERLGLSDAWPGHALYASHVERSDVFIHEDDVDRYPEVIRRRLGPAGVEPWRRLDLTGWSRDIRGTPIYPSGRVGNALAEFLEVRYAGLEPIRLIQWGRADPLDGTRDRDERLGLRAIRLRGEAFLLNARPEPSIRP